MNSPLMTDKPELEARIERLELIAMLLCDHAARGEGSMGKAFWEFADTIKRELVEPAPNVDQD